MSQSTRKQQEQARALKRRQTRVLARKRQKAAKAARLAALNTVIVSPDQAAAINEVATTSA